MTDYSKSTNFTAKDSLPSGDSNKRINGALFDAEFNPISTAISSKIDKVAGENGEIANFTSSGGLESTGLTLTQLYGAIYPVGSIYSNAAVSTNPATLLGFGTWASFGAGRVMVGLDAGNTNFDVLEETGGSADSSGVTGSTALTVSQMPAHTHTLFSKSSGSRYMSSHGGGSESLTSTTHTTSSTGSGSGHTHTLSGTNTNLQPYITVYMWKRTA